MAKLHELLAVEKTLESTGKKLVKESIRTLGKENLFNGTVRKLEMFDGDQSHLNTTEVVKLESTVDENIDYVVPHVAKWFDAVLQKDATNQEAKADIVMPDGTTLAEQVPATFLLGLESKLTALREWYGHIPTLAPGITWVPDAGNEKEGVFVTPTPQVSFKTEKDVEFRVVVEATEHHPADVRELSRTLNVGKYELERTSGMLSPAEKAKRIDKIDMLITAVKKARMRANDTKVTDRKIGQVLMDYINK